MAAPASSAPPAEPVVPPRGAGLGTFGGVYTPSILTILGVIMYLRFGWVVGNVGLAGTLAIVTLATAITFLTALSISEIATDQRVRVGGAYGVAAPDTVDDFSGYYAGLQRRVEGLPTTLFVLAAEDLAFGEVLIQRETMTG